MPLEPPGPNFWTFLVVLPTIAALITAALVDEQQSAISSAANVYVLVCFGIASLQCVAYDWWVVYVEGNLGMPQWVHIGAGMTEIFIIALRIIGSYGEGSDIIMTCAVILTCGLMGGAYWTWFVGVHLPHCFAPAALVLLATLVNKPIHDDEATERAVSWAMCGAFVIGAVSAALIRHYHTKHRLHQD